MHYVTQQHSMGKGNKLPPVKMLQGTITTSQLW